MLRRLLRVLYGLLLGDDTAFGEKGCARHDGGGHMGTICITNGGFGKRAFFFLID
jgi:hypothetical protein